MTSPALVTFMREPMYIYSHSSLSITKSSPVTEFEVAVEHAVMSQE